MGWTTAVSATIPSAINVACENIPLHEYDIDQVARYVRFFVRSYYEKSASLNYFNIEYDAVNGVFDGDFVCQSKDLFYINQYLNDNNIQYLCVKSLQF